MDVVQGTLVPTSEVEWHTRAPGEFPAVCRFCGDPAGVSLEVVDRRVRVAVSHDVPLCPEFVRYCEDLA